MHFECARGIFAEDGLDFTQVHNSEFIGQSSEKVMDTLSGNDVFRPLSESDCPLVKK